jgi:uroporphyrinogen-III decarboxylase
MWRSCYGTSRSISEDSVRREDYDDVLRERRKHEDYCVVGGALQPFEAACSLFGYDRIFRLMRSDPKEVDYALDQLFNIAYEQARLLAEAGVDQVYSGDDVGAQTTMMLSPDLWRRYLKPRYRRLAEMVHRGGSHFHFHSDGWIEPIIGDLVEVGVDVLEPLQPEAMDPVKIKRAYGDVLSFEGAISVQRTLPFGGLREVGEEVKSSMKELGPTGYVMRPSHTILRGTPMRNICELYRVARKFRRVK